MTWAEAMTTGVQAGDSEFFNLGPGIRRDERLKNQAARRFPPISIDRIRPRTTGRSARATTRSTIPFS